MDRMNLYEEATKGMIHGYQVESGVRYREERLQPQAVASLCRSQDALHFRPKCASVRARIHDLSRVATWQVARLEQPASEPLPRILLQRDGASSIVSLASHRNGLHASALHP